MRCNSTHSNSRKTSALEQLILTLFLMAVFLIGCESEPKSDQSAQAEPVRLESPDMTVDANAMKILERGLNALGRIEKFHLTTQQTLEDVIDDRIRIDYEMSADLTVDRPEKIRVERHGLEMHQILYYDGEVFTLCNPNDKVYASEALKGNIEDMFHMVRDTFGISASAADLIYPNAFELLSQNVKGGKVLGKEMIGDVNCDHLLFVRPSVSYQIWISDTEPYLPHKYVVTDTSTPQLLSYTTLITQWNLAPKLEDSMFRYIPSGDVNQIYFMKMTESVQETTD